MGLSKQLNHPPASIQLLCLYQTLAVIGSIWLLFGSHSSIPKSPSMTINIVEKLVTMLFIYSHWKLRPWAIVVAGSLLASSFLRVYVAEGLIPQGYVYAYATSTLIYLLLVAPHWRLFFGKERRVIHSITLPPAESRREVFYRAACAVSLLLVVLLLIYPIELFVLGGYPSDLTIQALLWELPIFIMILCLFLFTPRPESYSPIHAPSQFIGLTIVIILAVSIHWIIWMAPGPIFSYFAEERSKDIVTSNEIPKVDNSSKPEQSSASEAVLAHLKALPQFSGAKRVQIADYLLENNLFLVTKSQNYGNVELCLYNTESNELKELNSALYRQLGDSFNPRLTWIANFVIKNGRPSIVLQIVRPWKGYSPGKTLSRIIAAFSNREYASSSSLYTFDIETNRLEWLAAGSVPVVSPTREFVAFQDSTQSAIPRNRARYHGVFIWDTNRDEFRTIVTMPNRPERFSLLPEIRGPRGPYYYWDELGTTLVILADEIPMSRKAFLYCPFCSATAHPEQRVQYVYETNTHQITRKVMTHK